MRVLVVAETSMFEEGIEEILRREPGMEIVGRETDPGQAVQRIREALPDVVILTDGEAAKGIGAEVLGMVREGFHVRIVEVHVATNSLCVYCGEQQSIREVGDLVDAVKHVCRSSSPEAGVSPSPAVGEPVA